MEGVVGDQGPAPDEGAGDVLDALPDPVFVLSPQRMITRVNLAAAALLGVAPPQLVGRSFAEAGWLVLDGGLARRRPLPRFEHAVADVPVPVHELQVVGADGGFRVLRVTEAVIDGGEHHLVKQHVVTMVDVTALHQALDASEQRYRLAADQASVGMAVLAPSGRFLDLNPALAAFFGTTPENLRVVTADELVHPDDRHSDEDQRRQLVDGTIDGYRARRRFVRADGDTVWGDVAVTAARRSDGGLRWLVLQVVDVTEAHLAEQERLLRTEHDALTGLANRERLLAALQDGLTNARRTGTLTGIVFLDLDRFKRVNETINTVAGDRLLVEVAGRMLRAVRSADTVARLGGDEFAVVLPGLHRPADATRVAEAIRDAVLADVWLAGERVTPTVSAGVAVSDGNDEPDQLLLAADVALYRAKRAGRNRCVLYDETA